MRLSIKSKLFGTIASDGSFSFLVLPGHSSQRDLYSKNLDIVNHPVWTGKRAKEQTEIASFISRLTKAS
uniref:Ribosomal protein L31 n=1 Tax=Akkesiphycus lubricus TaxID=3022 RepID=A0A8F0FBM2_AKKLU|nr:ribosomal protein L31 [Akkesiphycus lubricus]